MTNDNVAPSPPSIQKDSVAVNVRQTTTMIPSRNNVSSSIFLFLSFFLLLADCFTLLGLTNLKEKPNNNVKIFPPPSPGGELLAVVEESTTTNSRRRREFLSTIAGFASSTIVVAAWARAPGSKDVAEAVEQIRDASEALRQLQRDWDQYARIDKEGRAMTDATVIARRILGGVGPMTGDGAIQMAKATPLYRIDGAFTAVRKASLDNDNDDDDESLWAANLDLELFEDIAERIVFQVQKADGDLYSVQFASKGTTQISGIYKEAKGQIDQGVVDFAAMLGLLKDAGAPGL
jgi:hypothetical protein